MKFGICAMLAVLLAGCSNESRETTKNWELPDGLKDCQVFYVDGPGMAYMRVVRCPNSTTSASGETKGGTNTVTNQ